MSEEKRTLYQLTDELESIFDSISESQGEISEQDEKKLAEIQSLLSSKVDSIVQYRKMLDDKVDTVDKRIKELSEHKTVLKNKIASFESYIVNCLRKMDIKKAFGDLHYINLPKPRKAVSVYNEKALPELYIKKEVVEKIDKKLLLDKLKSGEEIFGAELVDAKQSITFKLG